jgi:hypothetical protein
MSARHLDRERLALLEATSVSERTTGADGTLIETNRVHAADRGSFPFGAPACRIWRPARSVMQAARTRARPWRLAFEPTRASFIEPLMGWTGSDDPFAQVRLAFPTRAAAVAYAERHGLAYRVIEPAPERPQPRVRGTR